MIDERGAGGRFGYGTGRVGGFGLPIPIGRRGGGIGSLILVAVMVFVLPRLLGGSAGFDVGPGFERFDANGAPGREPLNAPDSQAQLLDFVSFVFDDVQQSWRENFRRAGRPYREAQLVVFTSNVRSGCGPASAATGPFYCSADNRAYLDLTFFRELERAFQAPGDFAQAYVIAHELGHHVQNVLGITSRVLELSARNPEDKNDLSIRMELQADCLAGVWAYTTFERGLLEEGDIEEGLTAAAAVGDDRIQEQATGRIDPETWTHGSAEQRTRWFQRGFESGDADSCDTFDTDI